MAGKRIRKVWRYATEQERRAAKLESRRRYRLNHAEKESERQRLWRQANKERIKECLRQWKAKNPDHRRKYYDKKHYGLLPGDRETIFASQGSKCAICRGVEHRGRNWHVDHCHASGKVRAILCNDCNNILGRAKDNPDILAAAIAYLRAHAVEN